jgi:hypothetical protein
VSDLAVRTGLNGWILILAFTADKAFYDLHIEGKSRQSGSDYVPLAKPITVPFSNRHVDPLLL